MNNVGNHFKKLISDLKKIIENFEKAQVDQP